MSRQSYKAGEVTVARRGVLTQVQQAKRTLISTIECGHRDWVGLRYCMDNYIDAQKSADVLAGYAVVDNPEGKE